MLTPRPYQIAGRDFLAGHRHALLADEMRADEAVEQAKVEHKKTLAWVAPDSTKVRSFRWFCDLFDLEHTAVRRAVQERRK